MASAPSVRTGWISLMIQRATGRPVTIVTGDLGIQLRADTHGLGQAEMPGKYSKDAMPQGSSN